MRASQNGPRSAGGMVRRAAESGIEQDAYTPQQVAERLVVPYEAVLKLIADQRLHAVKVGRYYRIPATAVAEFLSPANPQ